MGKGPLLYHMLPQEESRDIVSNEDPDPAFTKQRFFSSLRSFILFQILLLVLYTIVFFLTLSLFAASLRQSSAIPSLLPLDFPPLAHQLTLHPQLFYKTGYRFSPFAQPPSPATDKAWFDLLHGGNMRVSTSELEQLNALVGNTTTITEGSVRVADGSGDLLAKFGVYHELHCLQMMKRWLYPEHYYAGASAKLLAEDKDHLEQ